MKEKGESRRRRQISGQDATVIVTLGPGEAYPTLSPTTKTHLPLIVMDVSLPALFRRALDAAGKAASLPTIQDETQVYPRRLILHSVPYR